MESNIFALKNKITELELRLKRIRLKSLVNNISGLTKSLMDKILYQEISGFEKITLSYKLPSVFWQFSHLTYIIEKNCYLYLDDDGKSFLTHYPDLYELHRISLEETYDPNLFEDINVINIYFIDLIDKINNWISSKEGVMTNKENYILFNCLHYITIINENILNEFKILNVNINKFPELTEYTRDFLVNDTQKNLKYATMIGGYFHQGECLKNEDNCFIPDNQTPSFKNYIGSFEISMNVVTQGMYVEFIESGGYYNNHYWSPEGWRWKEKNNISCPLYWTCKNSNWYSNEYGVDIEIKYCENYPVTHISWFEADACAKWLGGRLPFEAEWEYCATNRGKTSFPWGIDKPCNIKNNLDGERLVNSSINQDLSGNSLYKINGLIGNAWEWCYDSYLPYPKYHMDVLNSSISYNNFDQRKKVLKGGSKFTSKAFISPKTRKGVDPTDRTICSSIRVVRIN